MVDSYQAAISPEKLLDLAELLCLAGVYLELSRDNYTNQKQFDQLGKPGSNAVRKIGETSYPNTDGSNEVKWVASTRDGQMVWTGLCDPIFLRDVVLKGVLLKHKEERENVFSFN